MLKIGVIGNCQADLIRGLLKLALPDAHLPKFLPNYLMSAKDEGEVCEALSQCDFVFSQRVSDDYGVEWLRISALRQKFDEKVIIWPNVYFDGFYPDIRYLYAKDGKVSGPLDDYHFDSVFKSFHKGLSVNDTIKQFFSSYILENYPDPMKRAFDALRKREEDVDVSISPFLEEHILKTKSFYTPNHPATFVLAHLVSLLCCHANLPACLPNMENYRFELDSIIVAPHPSILEALRLPFLQDMSYVGLKMDRESGRFNREERQEWKLNEMVEEYFRIYEAIR